ncbi:MAG: DsbA family protein [Acidobacteriota bacterium]
MRILLPLTLFLLLLQAPVPAHSATLPSAAAPAAACAVPADAPPANAVATIGGEPISLGELEAFVADPLARLEAERRRVLEDGLEGLLETRLFELEAKRRGLSTEALLEAEVDAKSKVTDEEIDTFYTQNQARIGRPKEAILDDLRAYLTAQKAQPLRRELAQGLRERFKVVTLLEPLRHEVGASPAPAKGAPGAQVTLVEFSDFQCPGCRGIVPVLDQVMERYGDKVKLEFRQFPLRNIHPQAQKAAEASLCAADQGEFWGMHDAIFANPREMHDAALTEHAAGLGLDIATFTACLESGEHADTVQADVDQGLKVGVGSTPSIYVNGRPVNMVGGGAPIDAISALVDDELRRAAGG